MKKLLLASFLIFNAFAAIAQEEEEVKTDTIQVLNVSMQYLRTSELNSFSIQREKGCRPVSGMYHTDVISAGYGVIEYAPGVEGHGADVRMGNRAYLEDLIPGLFFGYQFAYGRFEFDTEYLDAPFNGKYEYISPFSPEIGYKARIWNITAEAVVGTTWRVEIVGSQDVDNKNMNNWANYFGFRLGYQIK